MSYSPNIPNVGDFLSISQKQMLANFQAIDKAWQNNHVALTAVQDVGKNKTLTLRPTTDPATASNQTAIYNKIVTSIPQLFFRPDTNATPIQLSNSNLNTIQTSAPKETQSSFLAGPFTIYFGYLANPGTLQIVTLTPSSTLIYVGLSTISGSNFNKTQQGKNVAIATNITGNQFTLRRDISVFPSFVYYMAIGI